MSRFSPIDVAYLSTFIAYDPITGRLTFTQDKGRAKAGDFADLAATPKGYRFIQYRDPATHRKVYVYAHRLAWALVNGDPGEIDVDHEDFDRGNNKLANLKLLPPSINRGRTRNRMAA